MTSTSPVPDSPAPAAPKRRRGPFAFLFKTALGCTAFGLGCLAMLILLLPTMLGGTAAKISREAFAEEFHGTIAIEDVGLAWFGEQHATGVVVFDPDKKQVARASIVLPSLAHLLRSGKTNIGRVVVELDADLVQDDAGITNLQRALEPRVKPMELPPSQGHDARGFDLVDWLSRLDLDLEVKSKRLSWSDVDTRRVALPFEVRDFLARVTARPGAAIVVHAGGRIVAEQPGALELDAKLDGPMSSQSAWPFARVDATVRVENFSTAMIDGIANLQGDLKEVLGERFTLKAQVVGATLSSGDVDVSLASERAEIKLGARVENGALRSGGKSGFVAQFPAPRGFVKRFLDPLLPPGTTIGFDANSAPWRIEAQHFALTLPPSATKGISSQLPTLQKTELDLTATVPSSIAVQNDATRAATVSLAASDLRARVLVGPKSPVSIRLEADLQTGRPGKLEVEVSTRDVVSKLAPNVIPILDAQFHFNGLSSASLGALVGQSERLNSALGSVIDADLEVSGANLESGVVTIGVIGRDEAHTHMGLVGKAHIAQGIVHFEQLGLWLSDRTQWIEREIAAFVTSGTEIELTDSEKPLTVETSDLSIPIPASGSVSLLEQLRAKATGTVSVHLAGVKYTDATLRASKTSVGLNGVDVQAKLDAGGAATLNLRSDLAQGAAKGRIALDASTASAWAFADGKPIAQWPPIEAHVALEDVPAALADAFVQHDGIVGRVLGPRLSFVLDAHGLSTKSGDLRVQLDAPRTKATIAGKLDGGVFRASGDDGIVLESKLEAEIVRKELAAFMPAGSALTWPNQVAAVTLRAHDLAIVVPDFASGQTFDSAKSLDSLAAHVQVNIAGVGFENERTRAAKLDVGARDLALEAVIAPHAPLALKLSSNLVPGNGAKLVVDATLADPFAIVRGDALKPIDAKIGLAGLDTRALDVLAGQDGLLASLLGPSVRLSIDARGASSSSGALVVDAASSTLTLHAAAHFDDRGLHCTGEEGIDARITPDQAAFDRYVKGVMPAGSRLQLAPDAGALTVKLRDVDIALPKSSATAATSVATDAAQARKDVLERVSKLALKFDATLPALVYSDARTDAAQRPVTLRDVRIAADLAPNKLPSANLNAAIVDEPPGAVAAVIKALDPLSKLNDANGVDTFRANVDVKASNVPTSVIDAIAGQGGLLVEALGARVEFTVAAPEISRASGAFDVEMRSDLHSVKGRGHVDSGTVIVDQVDGLVATVGLGPVMSQRVVGKLLPTMVNVQKPADAAPAKFSVDALRFPLDGNLRNLDGVVRVDLGEVNYALFPKLASFFGESSALSALKIPAITVPIQKGVAGYQKLPVKIGGHVYDFSGTYDIVTDAAQLTANVPVKLLGKKVSSELERLREYIDPDLMIPLTIRGSLVNPSIGLESKALEKVLKDAGEKAVGKLGGSLLDDLLKKKKKKD